MFLTSGGYQCDGQPIAELDRSEILSVIETLKKNGERHIVVSGIFSQICPDQENEVVKLIHEHYHEASVTASNTVGNLGLLERENAALMNECIKPLCVELINEFRVSLRELSLDCPIFLTQNDGTLLAKDMTLNCPLYTIGTGMTNAMMGAAFLTGLKDALVVDIGGSSVAIGVLAKGLPRYASSVVKIGGIRTNFKIPDVISVGLGGGSYVASIGKEVRETVQEGVNVVYDIITDYISQIKVDDQDLDLPLILVGGGSIDMKHKYCGVHSIIKLEHFDLASAVGAALCQITHSLGDMVNLDNYEHVTTACNLLLESLKSIPITKNIVKDKQTVMAARNPLGDSTDSLVIYQSPNVNLKTGEWLLSEYDIECLSIGTGILGSG